MKFHNLFRLAVTVCFALSFSITVNAQANEYGIFDNQSDVGFVKHKGSVTYTKADQRYLITGSGGNIWFDHDQFHFVWKRLKGDFIVRTNAAFIGKGVELHRKLGWMVRSTLDSNATQLNTVVHGDGRTSVQFRRTVGAVTEEILSSVVAADVIQLERKGNTYIASFAKNGQTFVSQQVDLNLGDEVYVGLFLCSHNADVVEKAVFNNVRIAVPPKTGYVPYHDYIGSNIEILDLATLNSTIIHQSPGSIQAPNWTKDGKNLIYNQEGLLYKFDLASRTPVVLNTGKENSNNNDHVISFDGKMLAISNNNGVGNKSVGYTVPITGGEPTRITAPSDFSYMHGWSPDGKNIVFTGQRNGDFDIYKIPAKGGAETRLTTSPGLDDGPEYSPDGKYIYFNSVRSGLMQVWRMKADGSEQTQITSDDFDNWFPHISPDGKWIVYITFLKDEVRPDDHPFYRHVYLRLMPTTGGPSKVIAYLYGGQGTINTPSWSPDSKKLAFISNTQLLSNAYPIGK
jgi:TolB protein